MLTCDNNRLSSLPPSLAQCTHLQTLSAKRNGLHSVPDLSRTSLTVLSLGENNLERLPDLPPCLQQAYLGNNRLRSVEGMGDAQALSMLDVSGNGLKALPASIAGLPQLKLLDASNNDLSDIPAELGRVASLNKLVLDGNPLRKIPLGKRSAGINALKKYLRSRLGPDDTQQNEEEDKARSDLVEYSIRDSSHSGSLVLSGLQPALTVVPERLCDPQLSLKSLDLSKNSLDVLPDPLSVHAPSLTKLCLDHNAFSQLPPVLVHFTQLHTLELRNNDLTILDLPVGGGGASLLPGLRTLDLRNNRLAKFPKLLLGLPALTHLMLGFNRLQELPPQLPGAFRALEELDVSSNALRELPDGLRHLPQLSFLNIENNQLSRLPLELSLCPNLRNLLAAGNPQRTVSHAVLAKGTAHVLQYLRDKIPEGSPLLVQVSEGVMG